MVLLLIAAATFFPDPLSSGPNPEGAGDLIEIPSLEPDARSPGESETQSDAAAEGVPALFAENEPDPSLLLSVLLFLGSGLGWSLEVEGLPSLDVALKEATALEFRFGEQPRLAFTYSSDAAVQGVLLLFDAFL